MQLKQFSVVNLEDNLDLFDACADKFQKLPMYYLTFHGAQEVSMRQIKIQVVTHNFSPINLCLVLEYVLCIVFVPVMKRK